MPPDNYVVKRRTMLGHATAHAPGHVEDLKLVPGNAFLLAAAIAAPSCIMAHVC